MFSNKARFNKRIFSEKVRLSRERTFSKEMIWRNKKILSKNRRVNSRRRTLRRNILRKKDRGPNEEDEDIYM